MIGDARSQLPKSKFITTVQTESLLWHGPQQYQPQEIAGMPPAAETAATYSRLEISQNVPVP